MMSSPSDPGDTFLCAGQPLDIEWRRKCGIARRHQGVCEAATKSYCHCSIQLLPWYIVDRFCGVRVRMSSDDLEGPEAKLGHWRLILLLRDALLSSRRNQWTLRSRSSRGYLFQNGLQRPGPRIVGFWSTFTEPNINRTRWWDELVAVWLSLRRNIPSASKHRPHAAEWERYLISAFSTGCTRYKKG